jgi:hypothetical protein
MFGNGPEKVVGKLKARCRVYMVDSPEQEESNLEVSRFLRHFRRGS